MTLQTQRVQTLEQLRRVAEGTEPVDFEVDDLPAEPRKLSQQGLLDVVALVDAKRLRGHAYRSHSSLSGTASMRLSASGSRSSPA